MFVGYGTVVEVRINRNAMNKIPFGFVVFDDVETAQKVLAEKVSVHLLIALLHSTRLHSKNINEVPAQAIRYLWSEG